MSHRDGWLRAAGDTIYASQKPPEEYKAAHTVWWGVRGQTVELEEGSQAPLGARVAFGIRGAANRIRPLDSNSWNEAHS